MESHLIVHNMNDLSMFKFHVLNYADFSLVAYARLHQFLVCLNTALSYSCTNNRTKPNCYKFFNNPFDCLMYVAIWKKH